MAKKTKFIRTTPKGISVYPWLNKADTKFDANGTYKTDLKFDPSDIAELEVELEELLDKAYEETKADARPAVAKKITKADICRDVEDDQGEPTGEVFLRFKMNAKVELKDGSSFTQKPSGYDAKGKPLEGDISVYGGSELKINFEAVSYYNAKDKQVGLTLRLRAYQVIELVSSSSGDAASYGFGEVEDGFEQEESAPFDPDVEKTEEEEDDF